MQRIESLNELALDELSRVRRTLARRFGITPTSPICELGFGHAEKQGQLDRSRPDAFCFWVQRKRQRIDDVAIPAAVSVRLRRGQRFVELCLPTDVLQISQPAELSGRRIRVGDHRQQHATAGCLIAYRVLPAADASTPDSAPSTLTWAVLTVGHLLPDWRQRRAPLSGEVVGSLEGNAGQTVIGQLIARSQRHDGSQVDAALFVVQRRDLIAAGLLPENVSTRGKRVRSVQQLWQDHRSQGHALLSPQPIPIEIGRYYPQSSLVEQLGTLVHVFEAISLTPQTFAPGRSGTLWALQGHASGMQHAGYPTEFTRGLGQALPVVLDWATSALAQLTDSHRNQVDLRLIRAL